MENRQFERFNCEIGSTFKNLDAASASPVADTVIQDISEGGLRFRANNFVSVHNKLLFKINIPNRKSIEAVAQPAWIKEIPHLNQYDIGAKFLSLSDQDREIIRQFTSELPF